MCEACCKPIPGFVGMISAFVRDSTSNAGSCLAWQYNSVNGGKGQTFS